MEHFIIDAHSHLWLRQDTVVNGRRISPLSNGRADFMGEERQMLPPFMIDGRNTAEVFLSNMDYAQVPRQWSCRSLSTESRMNISLK